MFAEDISEDFSEDRRYHFYTGFDSISGYLRSLRGRLLGGRQVLRKNACFMPFLAVFRTYEVNL